MDRPHEVELKYVIADPDAVRDWLDGLALPGLTGGSWRVRIDRDTYVDTAAGDLAQAGYGVRIRRRGGKTTLALKSVASETDDGRAAGADDGVGPMRREEVEGPANSQLDPAAWPESAARELLLDLVGAATLVPLFEIRQRRQVREVRDGDGARAEISLDHGDVRRGRRQAGAFEALEVEARAGDAEAAILTPLAKAIEASGLGTPDSRSKLEIASALVAALDDATEGRRAYAALPKLPGVVPEDMLAEAGRKVLRLHLRRMLAMEAGTRSGADAEDLHKMRVATRRMRAAWRVFDGAYQPSRQRRYVAELKEVAAALGAVRDLDVQIDGLTAYRRALPESGSDAMGPLADAWKERRDAARSALVELLDSNGYGHFVDDYRAFTDEPGSGVQQPRPNEPALVREAAGGRIWQAYEHVRAHDAALRVGGRRGAARAPDRRKAAALHARVLPGGTAAPAGGPADRDRDRDAGPARGTQRRGCRVTGGTRVPGEPGIAPARGVTPGGRALRGIADRRDDASPPARAATLAPPDRPTVPPHAGVGHREPVVGCKVCAPLWRRSQCSIRRGTWGAHAFRIRP